MCKPGFWEKAMYRKVMRVTDHLPISSIGHKKRSSKPVANTSKKAGKKTTEITATCSKSSACWASRGQTWAHHIVAKDEDEKHEEEDDDEDEEDWRRGGFKLDESAPADFGVDCIAWKPLGWHVTIWPTFHQYPMISKAHNHCIGVSWDTMGYFGTSWDQSITIYWDIMTEWGYVILCHQNDLGLSWNMGHTHTHTPIYGHQNTGKCMGWNGVPDLLNNLTWKLLIGNFQKYMYIYYIYVYVYRYVLTYHDRNRADEVCSDMNRP